MINKNRVYVKAIKWFSKEAKEADVLISDTNYECWGFSMPCNLKVNDTLESNLIAFMADNIFITTTKNSTLVNLNELESQGIGKLINIKESIIQIGQFYLKLDGYLPGDSNEGDMISFNCKRIDILD